MFPRCIPASGYTIDRDGKVYPTPVLRLLLALNRTAYSETRSRCWSDNTWVIGYGDEESSMGFLQHEEFLDQHTAVPCDGKLHLELRLSRQDLPRRIDCFQYLHFGCNVNDSE